MNKQYIVDVVFNSGEVLTKAAADRVVELILRTIRDGVKKHEKVSVAGLGIFKKQKVAGRSGRNPRTGEQIEIPSYHKVKFQPAKTFKEQVQ